jgi:hypothetical protein
MCNTVKLTLKQVSIVFILGVLGLGTYLGHIKIQEESKIFDNIEIETCEILSTTKTNDIQPIWHNNWQYTYDNETYSFTDETNYEPEEYSCCFEKLNPCDTVKCPINHFSEYTFYLACGWSVGILMMVVIWCCTREQIPSIIKLTRSNNKAIV